VVRGTDISSFDVEVIDVVSGDPSESGARILVRVSGPAVDATGDRPRLLRLADLLRPRRRHAALDRRDLGVGRRLRRQGRAGDPDRVDPRHARRRAGGASRSAARAPTARCSPTPSRSRRR
jgi:hypothetical protein